MDYFKFASFRYLLCICVIVIIVQETSCALSIRDRTSPAKRACPPLRLTNGFVRLRSKGRIARYTCNTGYKIVGERIATCVRGKWEGNTPLCVKSGCLKVYAPKNGNLMEFYAGAVMGFYCDNGYALNGSRTIYCNGILWNGTVPQCQVDTSEPETSCDFESEDLCGWTQDARHNFDWRRHNFATPSGHVGTGPSYDHSKGRGLDGSYMYIESSSPRMVNDTARLFSPVYSAGHSEDACFVFWYHMFGATTGSLQVYQKPDDEELSSLKPLFTKSGNQGNQWFRALVRLNETKKPFQIIVEGVRGTGYVSDSAFDDVQLTNGTDCLEPVVDTSLSTPTRTDTGGGGEVLDDAQSCRTRCSNNPHLPSSSPTNDSDTETPVMVTCECHVGCLDTGTCCPDYSSHCIMAKVTPLPPVTVPDTLEYRTIASVHYFPLSPPRPTPNLVPPPLPTLPPKPTVATSQVETTRVGTIDPVPLPPPLPPFFHPLPLPPKPTVATSQSVETTVVGITDSLPLPPPLPPKPTVATSQAVETTSYFPLPPLRPTLNLSPPPLPPLPPKPTVIATQEPKILVETTDVVETTRTRERIPTQSYTVTELTNLRTNVDETYQEITEDPSLNSATMNTYVSKIPPATTYLPRYPIDDYTLSVISNNVDNNKDDQLLQTAIVSIVPTEQTLNLTTEAQMIQNNSSSTQKPTTLMNQQSTTVVVTKQRMTTKQIEVTTPEKPVTPRRGFIFPAKKPVVPKRSTSTTERPTTTTMKKTTTKNRMMYYPGYAGDKNDAETSFILKKELISQKGSSVIPWPQTQQATSGSSTISASMVIGIVGGIALLLVAFGVVAFAVVRRRRVVGGRSDMSDDSDVRFLTADEVLDFNIARPSEEDDRC